jgi:hypothetical protein
MPVRRLTLLLLVLVAAGTVASGRADAQTPAATPRRLPGHVLQILAQASRLTTPPNASSAPVRLTIVLNRSDQSGFESFLADVQNPNSPNYRRFLSQADLTARFGPSQTSYDSVLSYLRQQGFTLVQGSANRLTITVSGTRALADQALATQIGDFQLGNRAFFANTADPAVPATVAPLIQAIVGLTSLPHPEPRLARAEPGAQPQSTPARTPMALAQAYNFAGVTVAGSQADGSGEKVGLLEFDNYYPSDVTDWLASEGLSTSLAAHVSEANVDGGAYPPGVAGGELEVLLDIDTVLGMAQGANITVYDGSPVSLSNGASPIASWQDLFNAMIADNMDVISSSWGDCEWQHSKADATSLDSILAGAAASGISVFQAIGDHGAVCNPVSGQPSHVDPGFPDEDPNATGVGGTALSVTSSGAYQGESYWNDGSGSGGFGVSCCFTNGTGSYGFPRPAYQQGFTSSTNRSVPDVSADADPNTGIEIYEADSGGLICCIGGTSLAAPEWAAGLALVDQALGERAGNLDTLLYAHAGSNAFHPPSGMASPNNDFAHLGLGSFNLANLEAVLAGSVPAVSGIAPASGPLTGGTVVTVSGSNFAASSTAVSFGGVAATGVSCTTTQCTATSPARTSTGAVDVRVSVNGQTSHAVAADQFTYFDVPSISKSTLTATPPSVVADGTSAATVSVTLLDAAGVPVSGRTVTLAQGGGHSKITPASTTTDGNGVASFSATDTTAEPVTYTATDTSDSLNVAQTATVTFTPPLPTVSIQPAITYAAPGQSVSVALQVQVPSGALGNWSVTVNYDSATLTVTGCGSTVGSACDTTSSPNAVQVSGSSTSGLHGVQTLATLTFQGAGALGAAASLTLSAVSLSDTSSHAVSSESTNGTVRIGLQGDVNLDGQVSSLDALCVLRFTAGLGSTSACEKNAANIAAADVNGDTQVTSVDALCALRIVAQLPAVASCPLLSGPGAAGAVAATARSIARAVSTRPATATVRVANEAGSGSPHEQIWDVTADAQGLGAWTLDIHYDPTRTQVSACTAADGSVCNLSYGPGTIRIAGVSVAGLSGSLVLARLSLASRGRAPAAALTVTPVVLTDTLGNSLAR